MKKKSRFLTGLLSAVMALSLCALPAAAADEGGTPPTTTASTIDMNKEGSITIHKYLQKNADVDASGGTGEDNQNGNVPTDAEPAEGVGFTVYRVMDATDLVTYYNGGPENKKVTIDSYVENNQLKKGIVPKETYSEQKTDGKGLTEFKKLPVGLYVVIETSKPASVTQAVAPFLVSIPMTRRGETNNGGEWLYDVVVYPKNNTTTGNFELVKYGVVGDNKEGKVPVEGVQFKLEHLKDGVEYANAEDKDWIQISASESEANFVTGDEGKILVKDLKPGTYRFTEIGYTDKKEKQYIVNKNDQYVFVVNENGTTVTIPANAEHQGDYEATQNKISVYNYVPDVDKQVQKGGNWQKAADYSVGDKIPYQITVTVPANIARLKTFTVTDTPKNLTDDVNSIVVMDASNGKIENTKTVTYYTTKQNGDGFEIVFTPANLEAYAGQKLTITYSATLNKNAFSTTTDGNPNSVNLIYSKNVKQGQDDITPDGNRDKNTIKDEAVVYTFEINVLKKADSADGTVLDGVEFDLYKEVGEEATNAITGDDAKALGLEKSKHWLKINKTPLKTANGGKIKVSGLENGTYKLVETKTHDGYNLLSQPVDVTLNIDYNTTWAETKEYTDGVLTKHEVKSTKEVFKGTDVEGVGAKSVTVINRKGFDLPVTGGFGTLLFSAIGALLVVGGVGVLMSTKKKKGNG